MAVALDDTDADAPHAKLRQHALDERRLARVRDGRRDRHERAAAPFVGHAPAGQMPVGNGVDIEEQRRVREIHISVRDRVYDDAELALPPREGLCKAR